MRIKILTPLANAQSSFRPGEEVEWANDADAARLVAAGYAERVAPPPVQTATPPAPETAAAPAPEATQPPAVETAADPKPKNGRK